MFRKTITLSTDRPDTGTGSIFFIGTATTVISAGGFTILTDPNFLHAGDHAHLGYGLTSRRLTNPAMEIEELPELDLCLLSHLHGDHWDHVAEAKLPKSLPLVTTPHAARALAKRGFNQAEKLENWEKIRFLRGDAEMVITSMPGKHGPGIVNTLLPPVMGSMLEWNMEGRTVYRMYISGDTLVADHLKEIPRRFPDIDLGLFHLGGTKVLGILVTMDAKQGIEAVRIVHPREAIPIHYNDYTVFKSPIDEFMKMVAEAKLETKVHFLAHGERFSFDLR